MSSHHRPADVSDDGRPAASENLEARRQEHVDELVQMEDDLARAAEAAATAAAHAVAAAGAAEAASQAREAKRDAAADTAAGAARNAAGAAKSASVEAAKVTAASGEATVLESPSPEMPDQEPKDENEASPATEPHDGSEAPEPAPTAEGDESGDLLGLDSPATTTPRVLARLGLLALLGAAGSFVLSTLLVSIVSRGTVVDVFVLIAWLGVVALSIAGILLLAAAGITKAAGARVQTRTSTNST